MENFSDLSSVRANILLVPGFIRSIAFGTLSEKSGYLNSFLDDPDHNKLYWQIMRAYSKESTISSCTRIATLICIKYPGMLNWCLCQTLCFISNRRRQCWYRGFLGAAM